MSCNTQYSAPEDGRAQRPKHVELIGIINKPLLLHLVGYLHYLFGYILEFWESLGWGNTSIAVGAQFFMPALMTALSRPLRLQ